MEVHPPTKPIESLKDFLIHLSMITIGILIALGLEQSVEAWHHHELGIQARENILSEIRDNKREIDGERALVAKNQEKLKHTLEVIRQLLAHKKLSSMEMSIAFNGASFSSTSWTTAAATGSLGYMGYAEAKKFARAYDLQALLQGVQNQELRNTTQALAPIVFSAGGPDKLSDEQLRSSEREVLSCLAGTTQWDQLAAQLSEEYGRVLKTE
jgi:hypothetical protein